MNKNILLSAVVLWSLASTGCAADVPAHEIDAAITIDGVTTHSTVAFADYNEDEFEVKGDSTCKLSSGNCGYQKDMSGKVTAGAPLEAVSLVSVGGGEAVTYDLVLKRSPEDDKVFLERESARGYVASSVKQGIACRVYKEELGKSKPCSYSSRSVSIVLSRK
jgi:opacity protein-like surface antigen